MKITILGLAAAASLVAAQNFGAEPSCAVPCLASAISVAGCSPTDEGCQCGTGQAKIQAAVATCLIASCTAPGALQSAAAVGYALCSAYSASLAAVTAVTTGGTNATNVTVVATSSGSGSIALSTKVTAVTTSVPAKVTSASSGASSSSAAVVSKAGAPVVEAGIGGIIGAFLGVLAAL